MASFQHPRADKAARGIGVHAMGTGFKSKNALSA